METNNKNYISLNYIPNLDFITFFINFGGLLGLWHGISLMDLINPLKNMLFRTNSRIQILTNNLNKLKFLKIISKNNYLKVNYFSVNSFFFNILRDF